MNYQEFAKLPSSEKITLVTIEANTQFKLWEADGDYYFRNVPYFVVRCRANGSDLTKADSLEDLGANSWFFDPKALKLYCGAIDGDSPGKTEFVCTYKFFFANIPQKLPWDLDSGEAVDWDGRISKIGSLGQQLDDENTGIVMESASTVSLVNSDGFFDEIYDTLIWENQFINFYSWSPRIPLSQKVRLFSGIVDSKTFATDSIQFKTKDFIYRLRDNLKLGTFSILDGSISPTILGKPKRRIYGKVKNVKCVGVDSILNSVLMGGTISITAGSVTVSGAGTEFLKHLTPGDEITTILPDGSPLKLAIESIESNTSATLGRESDYNITNEAFYLNPAQPYRFKNRRWHIAGHELASPQAAISYVTTSRRFVVDSVEDLLPDDLLDINGQTASLRRISKNNLILKSSLYPIPQPGDIFTKSPVSSVYFGTKELIKGRDWSLENNGEAVIVLTESAEFNVSEQKKVGVNLTFTNGSRSVTTSATVDLRTVVSPNDWVKKDAIDDPNWYEVLSVESQKITLRTTYTGSTQTTGAKVKNIEIIGDDALITVDCIGAKGIDGKWIRTIPDAVKHLVQSDAGFTAINSASFEQAENDCPWMVSMVLPASVGENAPSIRDAITLLNTSVFGSLYGNNVQDISYSILNARKPEDLMVLRDDDIISWKATTGQKIINKVAVSYGPRIDVLTGEDSFEIAEHNSQFVDRNVGIENTTERVAYIYNKLDAETLAQRIAFYNSLSSCKVTLKGNLGLALSAINDKVYLELRRLFKRYSGFDRRKIGIVSSVKSDGSSVELEVNDLGNIFNRVPSVAPDSQSTYENSQREDVVKYGFILDNTTFTPNALSEDDFGSNRIG